MGKNRPPTPGSGNTKRPVILTPPGSDIPPKRDNTLLVVLITAGLIICAVAALLVILYVPGSRERTSAPIAPVSNGEAPRRTTAPPAAIPHPGAPEAERLLGEWLRQQARAEAENITAWGGDKYAAILRSAAEADQLLQQRRFAEAQKAYERVIDDLDRLLNSQDDLLAVALGEGNQGLENLDGPAAADAFARALAIDQDNEDGLLGAQRAANLDRVLALYRDALRAEKGSRLPEAARLLEEASGLDEHFAPAGEALARIENILAGHRYQEAMSQALAAIDQGNPDAADKALVKAAALRPDDQAVTDARRRLAGLKRTIRLQELRQKSERAAAQEDWARALELYTSALAVDPHAAFAGIGKTEAEERLALDKAVRAVMAAPERLQDDGPLREAEKILARAQGIERPGTVLSAQIAALADLIGKAAMTVDVVLRSDNLTTVEIYHVGRFAPFWETRLSLRPGTYTVVGKRPGFRDKRLSLTVKPEQADQPPAFMIRCEEPI